MRFRATLRLFGKTATGIVVPPEVVEALGSRKKPPVTVTLSHPPEQAPGKPGYTYRTTVATREGQYLISVSAEVRDRAGVAADDELDVDIALDTEPRTVEVPPDLAEALAREASARTFFEGLSASQQKAYVLWVEDAKRPETRATRVATSVQMLAEGRKRG